MYDLIKSIRNLDIEPLSQRLRNELEKSSNQSVLLSPLHQMDNWGYYHYFFARILYYLNTHDCDFSQLMRSKKQSSFVLVRIFEPNDKPYDLEDNQWETIINSIANYCLVRRYDVPVLESKRSVETKLKFLIKQNYLPELTNNDLNVNDIQLIITRRDTFLRNTVEKIWSFAEY
jgi:hypothetical protein